MDLPIASTNINTSADASKKYEYRHTNENTNINTDTNSNSDINKATETNVDFNFSDFNKIMPMVLNTMTPELLDKSIENAQLIGETCYTSSINIYKSILFRSRNRNI